MSTSRFVLPDVLKGIAVLLMIQVHITELFALPGFYAGIAGHLSLFLGGVPAAPLFMTAMGFFIGFGKSGYRLHSGTQTGIDRISLLRGFKLIILGFMLNIGLNLNLFYKIYTGVFQLDPLPYLFGADILFMAGVAVIVIPIVMNAFKSSLLIMVAIAFLIPVLSDILPLYTGNSVFIKYLMAYVHSNEWWSYFPLFPWLAYPFIGAVIGRLYVIKPEVFHYAARNAIILITALIPFVLFARFGFTISADLPAYYHHGIAFFCWAVLFMIIISISAYFLLRLIPTNNIALKYLAWIGKNVTAFYIIQWLIIGNIATAIYKTQESLALLIWFIGISAVVSVLVWAWERRRRKQKLFMAE